MKHAWSLTVFFLFIFIILLSPDLTRAQSSSPGFQALNVSLWPEYDRTDVLVIYSIRLSADTDLPVQLTFRLPGYIEKMHAVAREQEGRLVNVAPESVEWTRNESDGILTFPASSLYIHLEYYDPVILSTQNQTRQMTYTFSAPYRIETAVFEVQQPFQSDGFSLELARESAPIHTYTGDDGLQYSAIEVANLAPGDTVELSARYDRSTDVLSVQRMENTPAAVQAEDTSVTTDSSRKEDSVYYGIFYVLVGLGVASFLWWWHKKSRSRQPEGASIVDHPAPDSNVPFCDQCGTTFHEDANFCHGCGAERHDALKED